MSALPWTLLKELDKHWRLHVTRQWQCLRQFGSAMEVMSRQMMPPFLNSLGPITD